MSLILASASPRRAELLRQIGVDFEVAAAHIDESVMPGEPATDYVKRMARQKALATQKNLDKAGERVVLGADTCVICDDHILGKPADEEACIEMLELLSAREHQVLSAICILQGNNQHLAVSESHVAFRVISRAEAALYWATGEPRDKAGGYGIQGLASVFVSELRGSYSGVMGLPLFETAQLLAKCGVGFWQSRISQKEVQD